MSLSISMNKTEQKLHTFRVSRSMDEDQLDVQPEEHSELDVPRDPSEQMQG